MAPELDSEPFFALELDSEPSLAELERFRDFAAGFLAGAGSSLSPERTSARLASSAAIRSGAGVSSSACGCTAISSPAALRSIRSKTRSRYSSWNLVGSNSLDSESISCWAMASSRLVASASPTASSSSIRSGASTSSPNSIVDMVITSPLGRSAHSCCLVRSTTLPMPTLPASRIASSSSRYALAPPWVGAR